MIVTRKHRVPWAWIIFAQFPFALQMFTGQIQGTTFTWTFKKFIDNPAALNFILTVSGVPGGLFGSFINYISDRIWFPGWGRRIPFVAVSAILQTFFICLFPLAKDLNTLIFLLWGFQIAGAIGPTFQPLSQEIIPPGQRGMGSAIHSIMYGLGILFFYSVIIGRFDDVYFLSPLTKVFGPITGEHFTYWLCASMFLIQAFIVLFGVKELEPADRQTLRDAGGKLISIPRLAFEFFRDVFHKDYAPVYLLVFQGVLAGVGLGALGPLLYTEQWGYTKQDMGTNVAIGMAIMIPLMFFSGWLCDRFNKLKVFMIGNVVSLSINIAYIIFVWFILPDHRPLLWQIIVFGEFMAIFGWMAGVVSWPLMFEYVPRNKMGTASAGMGIMFAVFGLLTANLAGGWVTGWSALFSPHAGSKVQIVLKDTASKDRLRAMLVNTNGAVPEPDKLHLKPFFFPGNGAKEGRQWLIRYAEPKSESLYGVRKKLDQERTKVQEALDKDSTNGKKLTPAKVAQRDSLRRRIAVIDSQLDLKAQAFKAQMVKGLGDKLVTEGDQIAGAAWGTAVVVRIPVSRRVVQNQLEAFESGIECADGAVAEVLHEQSLIGNGIIGDNGPQGIAVAVRVASDTAKPDCAALKAAIAAVAAKTPVNKKDKTTADAATLASSLVIDSLTVGEKVPFLSYSLSTLEKATASQAREMFQGLRLTGNRGLRLDTLDNGAGLGVTAVFYKPFGGDTMPRAIPTPVVSRFGAATAGRPDSAGRTAGAVKLYDEMVKAATGSYLTVNRPIVSALYAPQEYDYFSGYVLTSIGGILGLGVIFLIMWLERHGYLKKYGLMEDEKAAEKSEPKGAQA